MSHRLRTLEKIKLRLDSAVRKIDEAADMAASEGLDCEMDPSPLEWADLDELSPLEFLSSLVNAFANSAAILLRHEQERHAGAGPVPPGEYNEGAGAVRP